MKGLHLTARLKSGVFNVVKETGTKYIWYEAIESESNNLHAIDNYS